MAGYYRKFCKNFSSIAEPLTNLLKKRIKFKWNDKSQDAFNRLKAILKSAPVLLAPDILRTKSVTKKEMNKCMAEIYDPGGTRTRAARLISQNHNH